MYLAFNDLSAMFVDRTGIKEADHEYYIVCDRADIPQQRGVFMPLNEESGELLKAIANGAIAVIWDRQRELPHYTPNHFPVFFTDDPIIAAGRLLQTYIQKLDGERIDKMKITNFVLFNKELLKENKQTYDIAVMLEKIRSSKKEEGGE
ncbi:hypothetical protein [Bacillus sp. MRMR6]|uniref:hypothetical protein n=1 Tax=Bacillus sp. MRMR6 TaxID=1928617 RepID=UPI0009523BA4|nr:hypothetical protein [Bacillus sp. MRMR6]OLS42011.1 hypothetical protein BTR25_01175 [Bacillus sp. MRMR6]